MIYNSKVNELEKIASAVKSKIEMGVERRKSKLQVQGKTVAFVVVDWPTVTSTANEALGRTKSGSPKVYRDILES
jgi:hypothetical protein